MTERAELITRVWTLRRALASDALRVTECVHAAYAHWVPRIGRQPGPMLQDYAAVIATEQVFVAEKGGPDTRDLMDSLVGVLVLSETEEGLLVDNVAVLPSMKGLGLGRALLVHAECVAVAKGYHSIYLYTNEKMTENIALYAKAGYLEYERRTEREIPVVILQPR